MSKKYTKLILGAIFTSSPLLVIQALAESRQPIDGVIYAFPPQGITPPNVTLHSVPKAKKDPHTFEIWTQQKLNTRNSEVMKAATDSLPVFTLGADKEVYSFEKNNDGTLRVFSYDATNIDVQKELDKIKDKGAAGGDIDWLIIHKNKSPIKDREIDLGAVGMLKVENGTIKDALKENAWEWPFADFSKHTQVSVGSASLINDPSLFFQNDPSIKFNSIEKLMDAGKIQ